MSELNNLLGREYIEGKQDCFSLVREYYRDHWGLHFQNYARPKEFWRDPNLNLYQLYILEGFKPVFDEAPQLGDGLLMPYMTPFATHAGVVAGDNKFLHHLPNQLSTLDPLRPKWSNRATIHLRHPAVTERQKPVKKTYHLHEVVDAQLFRDPKFQEALERAMESEPGTVRGDRSEG